MARRRVICWKFSLIVTLPSCASNERSPLRSPAGPLAQARHGDGATTRRKSSGTPAKWVVHTLRPRRKRTSAFSAAGISSKSPLCLPGRPSGHSRNLVEAGSNMVWARSSLRMAPSGSEPRLAAQRPQRAMIRSWEVPAATT